MAKKTFCLDVSSLDEEQRSEFAETLKTSVDDFNKKLESEEIESREGDASEIKVEDDEIESKSCQFCRSQDEEE